MRFVRCTHILLRPSGSCGFDLCYKFIWYLVFRGARVLDAPYREIAGSDSAALLFDMDEETLGSVVNGEFVGTPFRDLRGLNIAHVFFVTERLVLTRVLSGAGACGAGGLRGCGAADVECEQFRPSSARCCHCGHRASTGAPMARRHGSGPSSHGCGAAPHWVIVRVVERIVHS